jgi:hypothetical protein
VRPDLGGGAGTTEVRLVGSDPPPAPPPLCDWRALVWAAQPADALAPLPGDPRNLDALGVAVMAHPDGTYPALRTDGLLVLPADTYWRGRMRAVQCELTDPVSFALLDRRPQARFPNVAGWSAHDWARRAVAERRAAVAAATEPARELRALLSTVRAVLFLESLLAGEPELAVTVEAAVAQLARREPVAEEALHHYREYALRRTKPPPNVVAALRDVVMGLDPLDEPLRA